MSSKDSVAPVEYSQLGKSGLRVSVPILGGLSFGSDKWAPWVLNEDKSLPILKYAWDRGINTIDTANFYSNGESERIIGKFMKQYAIPREKIIVFTKCYSLVHEDISVFTHGRADLRQQRDYVNQSGLSRAAIFNQVERSLERLQTSYIDLLQVHRFDQDTPIEETMKALHDLVQSGKVRYIGASSMRAWQFIEMNHVAEKNGWTQFVSMQSEYSLLYREDEREMIPYCNAHGIGLIPWGVLQAGRLARPTTTNSIRYEWRKTNQVDDPLSDADTGIIARVQELAERKGWSMTQVALAWTGSKVTSPIVGTSSTQRVEDSIITGMVKELTDDEKTYLEQPYQPKRVQGHD